MMLFGFLWAAFAPLLLLAAWAGLAWLLRRFAPGRFGWRGALLLSAVVLGAPLGWIWRQDAEAFQALCRAEGATVIREKAQADGILLTSGTSNSFGMRYLHSEGFAWMESNDIYKRGGFVRYARNDKGEIATTKIDVPTARYEVRLAIIRYPAAGKVFERRSTSIVDRATGEVLAENRVVNPLLGWVDRHLLQRWFGGGLKGCGVEFGGMPGLIGSTLLIDKNDSE